jgi:hypothetical protein
MLTKVTEHGQRRAVVRVAEDAVLTANLDQRQSHNPTSNTMVPFLLQFKPLSTVAEQRNRWL